MADRDAGHPEALKEMRCLSGSGVTDRAGKSVRSAQVESAVPARISGQVQDSTPETETSHFTAKDSDDRKT